MQNPWASRSLITSRGFRTGMRPMNSDGHKLSSDIFGLQEGFAILHQHGDDLTEVLMKFVLRLSLRVSARESRDKSHKEPRLGTFLDDCRERTHNASLHHRYPTGNLCFAQPPRAYGKWHYSVGHPPGLSLSAAHPNATCFGVDHLLRNALGSLGAGNAQAFGRHPLWGRLGNSEPVSGWLELDQQTDIGGMKGPLPLQGAPSLPVFGRVWQCLAYKLLFSVETRSGLKAWAAETSAPRTTSWPDSRPACAGWRGIRLRQRRPPPGGHR